MDQVPKTQFSVYSEYSIPVYELQRTHPLPNLAEIGNYLTDNRTREKLIAKVILISRQHKEEGYARAEVFPSFLSAVNCFFLTDLNLNPNI